jgi:hypothetical protein
MIANDRCTGAAVRRVWQGVQDCPIYVCEFCFGPIEVTCDYERNKKDITKQKIESRPHRMWRYRELLPIDVDPVTGFDTGFIPLMKAENLAKAWGVKEISLKNDSVNNPTLSFKDRVVGGYHEGKRVRIRYRGMRIDRQPRQLRGSTTSLCPEPAARSRHC